MLAYGKRRNLGIGRVLMKDPALLLLEEPAAGLSLAEADKLGHFILPLRNRGLASC